MNESIFSHLMTKMLPMMMISFLLYIVKDSVIRISPCKWRIKIDRAEQMNIDTNHIKK